MKRVAVALVLLAVGACGDRAGRQLVGTFEAAQLAMRRGELNEALARVDRGLALTQSAPDSDWAWRFRLLRAEVLLTKPDLPQALSILDSSLPDRADLGLHARKKYLQARSQVIQGRLTDALATLEETRRLAPGAPDVRLDTEVLGGQVHLRLGQWAEAESRLTEVIAQASATGDRYHQALALNNLGMGQIRRNRLDEALSWFERVLSLNDLEDMLVYAVALNNAGACYARLGQFDRAIATQRRAVELHERRGSTTYYQQALGELGSTYLLQDDVNRAVPYFQRALTIATEANINEDAALWAGNLAAAYVELGRWDEAERFNTEAQRLNPPTRANKAIWNSLYAGLIAAGRAHRDEARRWFGEVLAASQGDPSVRWAAHDGLAGLSVDAGQPQQAARHFEAALDTIEKTRSDLLKTDYKLSFLTRLIRFYRAYVDVLVAQGAIDRALEVADSSRARVLAERHGVTAPARVSATAMRRAAKQADAVLLAYWLAPARSYLWIVGPAAVQLRELPPAAEIERLVRAHQQIVASSLADPLAGRDTAGDRLYSLLIEPVARSMPSGKIIIVPDGALHGLNFETLPVDGPRRHYWIEDAVVQIAPALAMLDAAPAATADRGSLLLFGDAAPHEPDFPALRYAATEMGHITRHFGSDRVVTYQGERASPSAYRAAEAGRFGLVHFTAHAAANLESPLDSAIILSPPEDRAGGFKLYARDVADLPLRAELVTVSACRSAGERAYTGEGLVGFAWAFLRAGARRVIAGLWDVDDRSTAELMDVLYGRLAAGDSPAQALREAKLSLLKRADGFAKPYYWAPFQLFTVSAS